MNVKIKSIHVDYKNKAEGFTIIQKVTRCKKSLGIEVKSFLSINDDVTHRIILYIHQFLLINGISKMLNASE